jgi:hypothetical protein
MFERSVERLQQKRWGKLIAYGSILGAVYFSIWQLAEPLGIPDKLDDLPDFMKRRAFYHVLLVLLVAPYVFLALNFIVKKRNKIRRIVLDGEFVAALNRIRERIDAEKPMAKNIASSAIFVSRDLFPGHLSRMLRSNEYRELRVVCYSLISSKSMEADIEFFLDNGGNLRVLMLDPESSGFEEKTALESFRDLKYTAEKEAIREWEKSAERIRDEHKKHIQSSIDKLLRWQDAYKNKVSFRLYSDTPNIRVFMFDQKKMFLSSYFYDPVSAGHDNPHLLISRSDDADQNALMLYRVISNWFEVKFATGQQL